MGTSSLQKNMIWNAAGNLLYLASQWVITVLVTVMGGLYDAGILSIAMSLSATFQTIALFGIRNYQVSDTKGRFHDSHYATLRAITCALAMVVCVLATLISGYDKSELLAVFLFMLFRLAECYSDVLHGIAQNRERLDLAGKSFAIKGVGIFLCFFLCYSFSRDLHLALLAMALFSCASTALFDLPMVKKIASFSLWDSLKDSASLALVTLPLCIYQFLCVAISSLPKLILEKECGPIIMGAYSSVFAPAMLLQSAGTYLYIPFATTFTSLWQKRDRTAFWKLLWKISLAMTALFGAVLIVAHFAGDWALLLVFGEQIRPFVSLLDPILICSYAISVLSFFAMVAIVLRRIGSLIFAYVLGVGLAVGLPYALIPALGANGTSYALLIASAVTALILLWSIAWKLKRDRTLPTFAQEREVRDLRDTHTFVLCAYGESEYIEDCLKSLLCQTVRSQIIMTTATPNALLSSLAARYQIPYFVRDGKAGITEDWNFGMMQVETPYATIAHQDDIYDPTYAETVLSYAMQEKRPIITYTDYYEIRDGARIEANRLLKLKKKMNAAMAIFPHSKWWRRRVMGLGNCICCPAVTYYSETYGDFSFDNRYRFVCDWDAWERLGAQKGAFLYCPQALMGHRIHSESETTKQTASNRRFEEEYEMFLRFWPKGIAKRLSKFYQKGADSNQL